MKEKERNSIEKHCFYDKIIFYNSHVKYMKNISTKIQIWVLLYDIFK